MTGPAFSEAGSVAWGRRLWGRLPGFRRMASAGFHPLRKKKRGGGGPLKLFLMSVYFQFVSSDLFEIVFRCGMVLCF